MIFGYKSLWNFLIGRKASSNPGSNQRRALSRCCIAVSIIILIEATLTHFGLIDSRASILTALLGSMLVIAAFLTLMIWPPFLFRWQVNPSRLMIDTVISMVLTIMVCSIWYRALGMISTREALNALDAVYFSAVTFSTLGFGDISPAPSAQLVAGLEALLGNVHLGFFVGSVLAATQTPKAH